MSEEPIRCPKCYSSQIYVDKRGFKAGRAVAGGLLTGNMIAAVAAGGIGMDKIELTCLKCGHKFKIKDAAKSNKVYDGQLNNGISVLESTKTAMFECDCGKKSCLETYHPICPKCGRLLTEKNMYVEKNPEKKGCAMMILIIITIPMIISFIL